MPVSPRQHSEGVVRVTVKSAGRAIADTIRLVSVQLRRAIGTVPRVRLVFADGDMPTGDWSAGDGGSFVPGTEITLAAGYDDDETEVFRGIVVTLGMRIGAGNVSELIVDCRDKAIKMTVGRRNEVHVGKTDSDIIKGLVSRQGLTAKADSTAYQHKELLQYYCTDWDFLLARAEANGLLVIVSDGEVSVRAPQTSASPALSVEWGADLIEFSAELDARSQYQSVQTVGWDPSQQAVLTASARPASLNDQGNLPSGKLAQVASPAQFVLQTAAALPKQALTDWAKAQQVKAGLARIRGRMKFQGSALAKVGGLIEVSGVGARFKGEVLVSAVEHEIREGNWLTTAEFGLAPEWFTQRTDVVAPPAGGWVPGAEGLQVGVVVKLDGDPENQHRIQIKLPVLQAEQPNVWARLLQLHASDAFGAFFLPEVGDEVVVGFFNHDPSSPVVLGALYSSKRKPPYALAAENDTKALVTRCKHKLEFDEKDKVITVTTPGNNKVVLSDKDKSILLQDQNGNKVELGPKGITLDTPYDVSITAKGKVDIDGVGAVTVQSKADVACKGLNVACEAQVGFTGKGSATAELSASGQTTVKGAMVMIN